MPSIFTLLSPLTPFQVWFVVYLYALPILLYASWALLSLMDLAASEDRTRAIAWTAAALVVPFFGAGAYLLIAGSAAKRTANRAAVIFGLLVWLIALAAGLWLAGGPLGPKALS